MLIFPELSTGHFPHYKISTPLAMPFRVMLCRKKLSGLEDGYESHPADYPFRDSRDP